jgi:Domain of unknown function (DUF4166)
MPAATTRAQANIEPGVPLETTVGDLRFRSLLSAADWATLPQAVRARFAKRLTGGRTVVYAGKVVETQMSRLGMTLAQLTRLIGSPLPLSRDVDVPSVVTVTEDVATGGQIWTRLYARRNGFPQVINSSKRFAGPTGLEEHVGYGVGMCLTMAVEPKALLFKSAGYFVQVGHWRVRLPRWMTPGDLVVGHHDLGPSRFAFTLDITHPIFGALIHQRAVFEETKLVEMTE